MKPFIKKEDFNFIKKCITDLHGTLRNCTDPNIIETNKAYINEKILSRFSELSNEEKELIDINKSWLPSLIKMEIISVLLIYKCNNYYIYISINM